MRPDRSSQASKSSRQVRCRRKPGCTRTAKKTRARWSNPADHSAAPGLDVMPRLVAKSLSIQSGNSCCVRMLNSATLVLLRACLGPTLADVTTFSAGCLPVCTDQMVQYGTAFQGYEKSYPRRSPVTRWSNMDRPPCDPTHRPLSCGLAWRGWIMLSNHQAATAQMGTRQAESSPRIKKYRRVPTPLRSTSPFLRPRRVWVAQLV